MMDDLPTSQRQPPCQPWVVQNGWTSATSPGPFHNPLPSFPHLSLGSPPGQTSCLASNNYSTRDVAAFPSRHKDNHNMQYFSHVDQSVKQIIPDANASTTIPAASQGRNIIPHFLPIVNEGTQPCSLHQMPLYSSPNSYQVAAPLFQPPLPYQGQLNGPKSPPQNHLPVSPPSTGQCLNQRKECSPQPVFDGANIRSSVGHSEHALPTSPIQHQPQWTVSTHLSGTTENFVPNTAVQNQSQTPQSPNSESRYGLDPELLPSAVKVMAEDKAEWEGKIFVSESYSRLPPLATTSCVVEDRGNASPFAIRSTSYCVPCEGQMVLLTHLPLGALVTPLVKQNVQEKPLPLGKDTDCVVGCGWCGASMCPAMSWQDCGQMFHCPFCGKLTEVPWQHYQPTKGVEGVRVDKDTRPELCMGSYEILHSQKGDSPALILAIDVSVSALRGGHLEFVTQQIRTLLASLSREVGHSLSDVRVGLMTYDSRIHLYDLSLKLSRPHMLIITETEDMQLPVREGLVVSLRDGIESIDSVLQLIPQFTADSGESSEVPVELPVKAGLAVLEGLRCPGKLLIFHTADLIEMGNTNSSSGFFGTNKPKSIFQPSEAAISLAKQCISQGCGIHLFVLSHRNVGGAWPGHVPYLTGGALHTYSHLQGELDRERFSSDLKLTVEADTAYKAELKIFVSKDLRVSGCYGLFVPGPSPAHVTMATLDGRTTVAVELAHTRALDESRGAAIQVVLLYSNHIGERRSRIHTLTLRCSRQLQDTFRNYQAQTLLTFYCKKMYCAALERPLQELREELQTEVTEALASYRKHCCSSSVSAGQLVLPQYLRALPVYINSLRKSEVLLPGLRSSVHQRLQQRCQVLGMDVCSTATHFYPLLLPLPQSDNYNPPSPEEALRCSTVSLEPRGLYLVHAPLTLLLWVGTQVPASTLVELFNISCFSSLPSGETKLPALENPLSSRVRSLVDTLNSQAVCSRKLVVVKQGDTCQEALQRHLVEDKSPNGGASYADFLYHLHVNSVRLLQ